MIKRSPVILLPVLLALMVSGCFWRRDRPDDCRSVEEYQASASAAPLQTPEGMVRDETSPVRIPDTREAVDPNQVACLEKPPKFFDRPPAPDNAAPGPGSGPPPPPPDAPAGPPGPSGP